MRAGYSGTPLAAKLGIKPASHFLLDGAPIDLDLDVPPGAREAKRGPYDVIVCFCPDVKRLRRRFPALQSRMTQAGRLWVAWPKKASGVPTDLTENDIRAFGLAAGLVDVKICAIDETWSGLEFVVPVVARK